MEATIENKEVTKDKVDENVVGEKAYSLKPLTSRHIFMFSTIIKKIGIKEFKGIISPENIRGLLGEEDSDIDVTVEKVGIGVVMDVATIVISNLESCKENIYAFLSDLSGMTKEEIDNLRADILMDMILDVFHKDEFKNFFKVAFKLFS